jgi:hypothetical protein
MLLMMIFPFVALRPTTTAGRPSAPGKPADRGGTVPTAVRHIRVRVSQTRRLPPVREMQFDSSLPRYRRTRSAKRKKLGELLYRDLANCRTVITQPQR